VPPRGSGRCKSPVRAAAKARDAELRCGREETQGPKEAHASRRKNARALCSAGAFVERHPATHLIIGRMPQDLPPTARRRQELSLMARLVARLAPMGRYALSIDRRNPTADIHCVSKQDIDAPKVAGPLGARKVVAAALDGVE
jgi:hypothetical protein